MPWFDDWNFGAEEDPAYRRNAVEKRLLAPLGLSFTTDDKIGGSKEPAKHDYPPKPEHLTFPSDFVKFDDGTIMTVVLAKQLGFKIDSRPRYDVGDPEGDRDVG